MIEQSCSSDSLNKEYKTVSLFDKKRFYILCDPFIQYIFFSSDVAGGADIQFSDLLSVRSM